MAKNAVPIDVPKAIKGTKLEKKYLETAKKMIQEETVLRLFEQGEVSSGYGAELLGITRYDLLAELEYERIRMQFLFTRQRRQEGLGDAILCGRPATQDAPFVVALSDKHHRAARELAHPSADGGVWSAQACLRVVSAAACCRGLPVA